MNEYIVVPEVLPEGFFWGVARNGRIVVHELSRTEAEEYAADYNKDQMKQEAA